MQAYRHSWPTCGCQCARTVSRSLPLFRRARRRWPPATWSSIRSSSIEFIEQTPLHYVTALSEKGMRADLVEEVGDRKIANVEGMRVLNSIGPVIFRAWCSPNTRRPGEVKAPRRRAERRLPAAREEDDVAATLMVRHGARPGRQRHLNLVAMNNGIPVIALPELRTGTPPSSRRPRGGHRRRR